MTGDNRDLRDMNLATNPTSPLAKTLNSNLALP